MTEKKARLHHAFRHADAGGIWRDTSFFGVIEKKTRLHHAFVMPTQEASTTSHRNPFIQLTVKITGMKYYVYILTNYNKTVLYTGVTNNLEQRIIEHYLNRGNPKSFTGRYHVFYLLFYEGSYYINNSIAREKEIKGWRRSKKEELIRSFNPEFKFLNEELFGTWPPEGPIASR